MDMTKQMAANRLKYEYDDLYNNPIANIGGNIGLFDEDNLFEWKYTFFGPRDTPYSGGLFYLRVHFPDDYPQKPPEVCFTTPIYHVNINPIKSNEKDSQSLGHVCINTLNWWKPEYTMREVLNNIYALFYKGNPDSPYGIDRAIEYSQNKELFDKKVKYFTEKYASPFNRKEDDVTKSWDFTYNP